ncbi:MAG: hypothetical protein ACIAQZ_00075 [Sedimentisphaeraceae bacterium JB056]
MRIFCSDRDLLKYESEIFSGQTFSQFVLCKGTNATISNSYLSANNVDFIASGVGEGNVIFVSDEVNGWQAVYEVVQCVLAGQIRLSVIRPSSDDTVVPVNDGVGLSFQVVSFKPVMYEVSYELARYFSLVPAVSESQYSVDDISDASVLRDAATFGSLARLYAVMPFGNDEIKNRRISDKHSYYLQRYYRSRETTCVSIDTGDDGNSDAVIAGGQIEMKRG